MKTPETQHDYASVDETKIQTENDGLKDEGYDDGKTCKISGGKCSGAECLKRFEIPVVYRTNEDTIPPETLYDYAYIDDVDETKRKSEGKGNGCKDEGYGAGKTCQISEENCNGSEYPKCPAKNIVFCIGMVTAVALVVIAVTTVLVMKSNDNIRIRMNNIPDSTTVQTPEDVTMIKEQPLHGNSLLILI